MLLNTKFPSSLDGKTLLSGCHIINRIPSKNFKVFLVNCKKRENSKLVILKCGSALLIVRMWNLKGLS